MNDFAVRLGWVLVHFLWQGAVIAMLLAVALRWARGRSANLRYLIGWLALVAMAACLPVTYLGLAEAKPETLPAVEVRPSPNGRAQWKSLQDLRASDIGLGTAETAASGTSAPASGLPSFAISHGRQPWITWVVVLWGSGVMLLSVWRLVGFAGIARIRRRAMRRPAPDGASELVATLCDRIGVSLQVFVRESADVAAPMVTGVVKPLILLPASALTGLSRDQVEAVLAHELAHVRRHDFLLNAVQVVIETLLFHHPAVWWTGKQIRRERENCCDDAALEVCQDRRLYAAALRELAELGRTPALAMPIAGNHLLSRIRRVMGMAPSRDGGSPWLASALLVTATLLAGSSVAKEDEVPESKKKDALVKRVSPMPGVRGHLTDRKGKVLAGGDPYMRLVCDMHLPPNAGKTDAGEKEFRTYLEEQLIPALKEKGIEMDADEVMSARKSWRGKKSFKWDLDSGEGAEERFRKEGGQLGVPRVVVERLVRRTYPLGALASHSLGYATREVGRFGVEKSADEHLRGVAGEIERSFDNEGNLLEERVIRGAAPGSDVTLTLDAAKQFIIEQTFREAKIGRGAAVLLDVETGDVLAIASVPSFDPTDFVPFLDQATWKRFMANKANPLFPRALGAFPPASTMKAFVALAGDTGHPYHCKSRVTIEGKLFHCWNRRGHGELRLLGALTQSCNCYFYQYAIDVGIDRLDAVLGGLGFGRKSGIELDTEPAGLLPSPSLLEEKFGTTWSDADSAQLSIGHGHVQASPLQVAAATATIANGGTYRAPRLLLGVDSNAALKKFERPKAVSLAGTVPAENIETVRLGMKMVVNEENGTGRRARSAKLEIAGKTGTAQWNPNHENLAWFTGFAPFEDPKYALSIVIEGGKGGGVVAAPIAKRILEACKRIDDGDVPELKRLAPVVGHLDPISAVEFGD